MIKLYFSRLEQTHKMKLSLRLTGTLFATLFALSTSAQMVIDNTQTPTQLVEDVLLGQGVTATNITFVGDQSQIGFFDASNANFSIPEGVVMSTGDVTDIPAAGGTFASTILGGAGDADLDVVSPAGTNDAVVLQFDFVPTGDSIEFNYVFGSEEYPEFVNAGFNDAFAFIISGPGFNGPFANGGENIALLPGTTTPVTIDNVNDGLNSQYYVDNAGGGANGIVFDGYTVTLTALAQVQCGETYTLKLVIADGGDSSYDSGVFLEARSFSSNAFTFDVQTPSLDSTIIEGCTSAEVNIFSTPADSLLAYDIILGGNAIEGEDYEGVPDSLIIQPGDSIFSFEIIALNDGISESGTDTITLTVFTVNSCGDTIANTGVVFLREDYTIDVDIASEVGPCPGYDYEILTGLIDGGNQPYSLNWSTGATTPSIEVGFPQPTTVEFYVTDLCGTVSDTASVLVGAGEVPPPPAVSVSNDVTLVCPGDQATLTAIASSGSPTYSYSWSDGAGNTSTVSVQPSESTDYIITVTDNCLLQVQDTISVTVEQYVEPTVSLLDTTLLCPEDLVILSAEVENGSAPFSYAWSTGSDQESISENPATTTDYTVTVTDNCGSSADDVATVEVPEYDDLLATVTNSDLESSDTITICELWADTVSASISGGLAPYALTWSGTLFEGSTINAETGIMNVNYELPADSSVVESYSLTVVDQCMEDTVVEFPVEVISCDVVAPDIFNPESEFAGTTDFCGNTPQNNAFNLPCLNLYPGNEVTIWDRWGRKVYKTEDYHLNPWDGGNQATGTFFYVCELPGDKEPVKGYFQLVR
jgi:hypothetical protein